MPIAVQNIIHINVNCTDIAASKRFFETVVGLTAANHLKAEPQAGEGMGLNGPAQWDGYAMQDAGGWSGTMVDLLQWRIPPTEVQSANGINRLGYTWLTVDVPDVAAVIERARQWTLPVLTVRESAACWLRNPDGLPIEMRQAVGQQVHLAYVTVNCRDLVRTRAWYGDLFGFQALGDVQTLTLPATLAGAAAPVTVQAQRMGLPDRKHGFGIRLMQRPDSQALLPPLAKANAQGIYRMALAVEDISVSYLQLRDMGADCPLPPCWVHLGPESPVEAVWALFFRDPDGTCVELIQTPQF